MSSDASVSAATSAEEREPGVPDSAWSTLPWYKTGLGLGVVAFDVVLTIALALGTTGVFDGVLPAFTTGAVGVPLGIYAFCLLGALGYVFTTLVERFDSETERVLRYNVRLPAALPLGAGIYVLSEVILGTTASQALVYGLVFLSGLYVNLAYKRLGALARRLLPEKETANSDPTGTSADTGCAGSTTNDSNPRKSGVTPGERVNDTPSDREPVSVSRATPEDESTTHGTSTSSTNEERDTSAESPNTT